MVRGKAGVMSKLCAGQATEDASVDRNVEPLEGHWDKEIAKRKCNMETKHVRICSNYKIKDQQAKIQFC